MIKRTNLWFLSAHNYDFCEMVSSKIFKVMDLISPHILWKISLMLIIYKTVIRNWIFRGDMFWAQHVQSTCVHCQRNIWKAIDKMSILVFNRMPFLSYVTFRQWKPVCNNSKPISLTILTEDTSCNFLKTCVLKFWSKLFCNKTPA